MKPDYQSSIFLQLKIFLSCAILLLGNNWVEAQTNPQPQAIPYAQDFDNNWFQLSGLPAGFAVWRASAAPRTSNTSAANSFPNNNETAFDSATTVKSTGKSYGYSAVSPNGTSVNNGQLYIQTSSTASGTDQLVLAINTIGFTNITVSFDVEMINPQPKLTGFVFQYRTDTVSSFITIDSSYWHNSSDRLQNQIDNYINLALPMAACNRGNVQLRWATSRNPTPLGAASCGIAFDNIIVNGTMDSPSHFRSISSGLWKSLSSWESSTDSINWLPAQRYPTSSEKTIKICRPHTIRTDSISVLVIDETTIDSGATFWNAFGTSLAINKGPDSIDLIVKGIFADSSNRSVVWTNTSSWVLSPHATYIKTTNSNSTNWQLHYFNGINSIPGNSNWICRKPAGSNVEPSISTTNGGPPNPQVHYGNLSIENFSGFWNSNNLCKFSGSANYPIIKGNFHIGGNGSNAINFHISNTNALPVKVLGNTTIETNSTLTVTGTGLEIQGDLNCSGMYTHVNSNAILLLSGSNFQTIDGTGIIQTYNLEINKPSENVQVKNNVNVYGNLNMLSGIVNTFPISKIIVQNDATCTNASNNSFINGPIKKIGDDAFTFPVGKSNDFQPISIDTGLNRLPMDGFTAEYFYINPQSVYGNVLGPGIDHISNCEYWYLNSDSGTAQKKVGIWWDNHSCGITNLNNLRVVRCDSMWFNIGMTSITGALTFGTIKSAITSEFGPITYGIVNPNPVNLPVSLILFTAEYNGKNVDITWETASESNNQSFTVQRSKDGDLFESLFTVAGAGNSNTVIHYSGVDENPLPGISYYRLKQNDFDGQFSYSDILPVRIKNQSTRIVSLVSSKQNSTILLDLAFSTPSTGRIEIKDLNGKNIITTDFVAQEQMRNFSFNTGNMSSGIYFLRITYGNEVIIRKFIY